MQTNQNSIYQQCGHNRLYNTDEDCLAAHVFQLSKAEFVTHGKSNKAQSGLGQEALCLHLLHGLEAKTADAKSTKAVRAKE